MRDDRMAKGPLFYLLSTVFFALGGVLTFAPELVLKHCAQRDAATFSTALAAALSLLLSGMMCTTGSPVAASKCVEGSNSAFHVLDGDARSIPPRCDGSTMAKGH